MDEILELMQKVRDKMNSLDEKITRMEVRVGIRRRDANPTSGKVGDANPTGKRGNSGMETPNPGKAVNAEAMVGATHAGMTWDVSSKPSESTHAGTTSAATFTPGVAPLSEVGLANPAPEAIHPSVVGINEKRAPTLDILDEHLSVQDVRTQQVVVGQAVADIIKSSLDPIGFNEKLVDDIGDKNIMDDEANGATALKILEDEHPIVKVLGELAELQDKEVSNGMTEVSKYVEEEFIVKDDKMGKEFFINYPKTSLSLKLIAGYDDFFANLVEVGVQDVKLTNAHDEAKCLIDTEILEARWKSVKDSYLVNGYAMNTGHATQRMSIRVCPAKIVCLDFHLQKTKRHMSVQVVVIDPRGLEETREMEVAKERIKKLIKAWANVFLSTKGIDDMSLKYLVKACAIHVRRVRKEEMRHVAKAPYATLGFPIDMEGAKTANTASLILRGVNDYMLAEIERIHPNASLIFERTLESNTVVAGGSAVDLALPVYLGYLVTPISIGKPLYTTHKEIKEQLFDVSKESLGGLPFIKLENYQYLTSLLYEDYYACVEGRDIISNLRKVAGLAAIFAAICLDNDNVKEYVRNYVAKVFGVVASVIGILELLTILEIMCQSKKL
ncbi:hypothetical protein MLD38_000661 [Melastoma candidum]|uniref:Uncharacterized protein n=1 Tax=Melastoma candidum TaxID=119954 RepID=A0ACB9SFR3_9MYRT|nr:hypothetical protein MLD38_000661 [Melastoma candidum]